MKASVKPPAQPSHVALVPIAAASLPPESTHRFWLYGIVRLGIAACGAYAFNAKPWAGGPMSVPVEIVQSGPVTRAIAVNGRIAARTLVELGPSTAGRIVSLSVGQGDGVNVGDVLAQQDDASQRAVAHQAFSSLDAGIVRQSRPRQMLRQI